MKRRWNLYAWAGFLVTLLAFLSYFMFFARFPATRDFPWVNLLMFAAGGWLLGLGLRRRKTGAVILALLSAAILGFFVFYNFYFSRQLPASAGAPRVGQKAPDFTLPDQNGRPVTLAGLLAQPNPAGQWILLVFYRGYW